MSDETPLTKPPPVRKRRWFRFSLRTFLLVVTVLCVWLGIKANAARRQKEAVDAILMAGGTVYYDYQILPNIPSENHWNIGYDANALPTGPLILRKLFGDDFFRKVILVRFNQTNIPEAVLRQLTKLPDLTHVALQYVKIVPDGTDVPRPIQDADFEVFRQLSRLELLEIGALVGRCSTAVAIATSFAPRGSLRQVEDNLHSAYAAVHFQFVKTQNYYVRLCCDFLLILGTEVNSELIRN